MFPKNQGENFSSIFTLEIFWGKVTRYAAIPLIVALSAGHSHITRFPPLSPIATGTHLVRAVKIPNFTQLAFLILLQIFRDPLHGELSHIQIFMNDGPNPLT